MHRGSCKILKWDFIKIKIAGGFRMAFQEVSELEAKIDSLISTVIQLRKEREELLNKLEDKEEENRRLKEEIDRREEEKRVLKEKIGGLIEKLSQV
jgi:chromosome segregation ATPase